MTDWITVALSGGSVCLGGALAMLGQYFADRRSQVRDREARREGFRISNYEIQRNSLHELQETMLKLDTTLSRVSIDSKFRDSFAALADYFPIELPPVTEWYQTRPIRFKIAEKMAEVGKLWEEGNQPDIPIERRLQIATRIREAGDEFRTMQDQLEPDREAFAELQSLHIRIKILSARTSDDIVFTCSEDLIRMLSKRTSAETSEESKTRTSEVRRQVTLTLDAINNALRKGPSFMN